MELELIELTLGFRDATPELLDVAFQTVPLIGQFTEGDGQRFDGPGRFRRQSGLRRALTLADKPGHWPTLTSGPTVDRLPRRRSADRLGSGRGLAAGSLDSHLGGARTLILPGRIGPATRESA